MKYLQLIIITASALLVSCRTMQVVPTAHERDSVRIEYRLDSVYILERDSVWVDRYKSNDTIYITKDVWKWRYKDIISEVHDTISVATTDTIVQQVEYTPAYYKNCTSGFWVLFVAIVLYILIRVGWWLAKKYLKTQTGGLLG